MPDEPNSIDEILERVHRLEDWMNVPDDTDTSDDTHEDEVQPPQFVEALTGAWAAAITDARRAKSDEERKQLLDRAKHISERRDALVADEFYVSVENTEDSDLDLIQDTDPELHGKIIGQRQKVRDQRAAADEQRRRDEEFAARSAEEQAKLRAAAEAEAIEQHHEDDLQALADQTAEAIAAPGDFSEPGQIIVGAPELLKPRPPAGFKSGYAKAVESNVGLFAYKRMADEVVALSPALQAEWWDQRSEFERHVLARAFGLRPPMTAAELETEE
jgi:hypothetical protein